MFFNKKKPVTKPSTSMEQALQHKADTARQDENASSPLLERYLQKSMTDHMKNVSDEH